MKRIRWLAVALVATIAGLLPLGTNPAQATSTLEVSQPTQITSDSHYERGNSVLKDSSGDYWLFYGQSEDFTGNYGSGNPDNHQYVIYYKTTGTIAGLASATPQPVGQMPTTTDKIYQGQTSSVEYDGKIWVFAVDMGDSGQVKAWTTSDGGSNWSVADVLPSGTDPFEGTHLWATVHDSKIFLAVNRGGDIDLTTYTTAGGWTAETEIVDHEGMPRFYDDSGTLYFYYTSWGLPAYYIYEYNDGTGAWSSVATITGTEDDDCDPMLTKVGSDYVFIFAPWDGTKQYLRQWTSSTIAGLDGMDQDDARMVTRGGYGGTAWWVDMWPAALTDGSDVYMFYGSEASGTASGTGNIFMLELDWLLANDHYLYIQNAIDEATSTTINVAPGTYDEALNIDGLSGLTIDGADSSTVTVAPSTTLDWNVGGYGSARQAVVRVVDSTDIDISNITFDFDSVKADGVNGFLYWDSSGALESNVLKNMSVSDTLGGGYSEITSYIRAPNHTDTARAEVSILNNTFIDAGRLGVVTHDFVDATIEGNTFYKTIDDFGYAIELGSESTGVISGNTIYGYDTAALSDGSSSAGIYVENAFTGGDSGINKDVLIEGNEVYDSEWGIVIGNEWNTYAGDVDIDLTLQGNDVHDNLSGGVLIADEDKEYGSSVTVSGGGNTLTSNGDYGYYIYTLGDGDIAVDLTGEIITGHGTGVFVEDTAEGPSSSSYSVSINLSDISGNTTNGVDNTVGAFVVDATGNWWGDASGPHQATHNADGTGDAVSDNVAYSPWLGIGSDAASGDPGFQPESPMTFIVEPQVCLPVGCIQQGVNLAGTPDTLDVKAGTYDEQVLIDKPLTVDGAGQGTTTVQPNGMVKNGERLLKTKDVAAVIAVDSTTDVTIQDLTVDASLHGLGSSPAMDVMGVYWRHASGTLENAEVTGAEMGSGAQTGLGVFVESDGGQAVVEVSGCSVHNYQKNGITANGDGADLTADGNTVVGWGPTSVIGQNGIQIGSGAGGTVTGNEISGHDYTPSTWAATAILVTYAADGVIVSGNDVHDNMEGIFVVNYSTPTMKNVEVSGNTATDTRDVGVFLLLTDDSEVSGNIISSSGIGLYLADASNIDVELNTISGNDEGFVIDGDAHNIDVTGNEIVNNTNTGVTVLPYGGYEPSGIEAHMNQIAGNGTYGVDNSTSNIVDALSNWWGDVTGPYHPTTNPLGQGDQVSDYVLFDPWLKGIEYVGDKSVPLGSTANLRARFVNSDDSSPAVAGAEVYFDLVDSGSVPVPGSPFSAVTEGTGVASVPVSGLGVNVYTVTARFGQLEDSVLLGVFGPGDSDGDGIIDISDNCPADFNPDQINTDGGPLDNGPVLLGNDLTTPSGDGYGDVCDDDDDNDWLTDTFEAIGCGTGPTAPLLQDTDGDLVVDGAECLLGSDPNDPDSMPAPAPAGDADGDGLPANIEALFGSSDSDIDSDSPSGVLEIDDGTEVKGWATHPNKVDSDNDACADWIEIVDINGDGFADITDVYHISMRAFGAITDPGSDHALDINKDQFVDITDVFIAVKNSGIVKDEYWCPF